MINAWSEKNLFALFKNIVFLSSTVRTITWEKDQLTFWYWERKINTSFDANWRKLTQSQTSSNGWKVAAETFANFDFRSIVFVTLRLPATQIYAPAAPSYAEVTHFYALQCTFPQLWRVLLICKLIKLCILKHFTQYDPFKHIFYAFKRPSDAFKVTSDALCSTGDVFNQSNTCH